MIKFVVLYYNYGDTDAFKLILTDIVILKIFISNTVSFNFVFTIDVIFKTLFNYILLP